MATITETPVAKLSRSLEAGDLIFDDIMAKVVSVETDYYYTTVFVEDVNGFRYHLHYSPIAEVSTFPHLEEEWTKLHTYMTNDDPSTGHYWDDEVARLED